MREKIAAALIAVVIVFVSLPGVSMSPILEAKQPPSKPVVQEKPRPFVATLPISGDFSAPKKVISPEGRESLGVKITAPRIYVVDERTGYKLYGTLEDDVVPIASITKLMTARVFRTRAIAWDKVVDLDNVVADGGVPYFASGDKVTVRDLWQAMIVGSSNTAALVLAKVSGLSDEEFVSEMNANAAGLGMTKTLFVEPTGLDERNVSSAKDIAILSRAQFLDPEIVKASAIPYFDLVKIVGNTKRVYSTDKLLGSFLSKAPYKLLGAKTGYITESGYNIVVSVGRDDAAPITVVVLGSASNELRFQEAKSIAYWAFENYRWPAGLLSAAIK